MGKEVIEKEKMQEYLFRLNRLKSLGELTAGIVHEIRNPLASISTNIQYINENVDPTFKYYEEIQDVLHDISDIEKFINKILKFAKPGNPQLINTNVNNIINEVLRLLKKRFREKKVNIEKIYDEKLPHVLIDPEQIKQVLINIFTNNYHAIPEGGTLTITTRTSESPALHIHGERDGSGIEIVIADTGYGIAPENMSKIFDPFFTTNHEGTGLGLSISQRIIEQHGGSIRVESTLGQGTIFTINLPIKKKVNELQYSNS